MFLIGDKRLFPADPVLGAMGKGCTAQSQAILGRERKRGSGSVQWMGKASRFPA